MQGFRRFARSAWRRHAPVTRDGRVASGHQAARRLATVVLPAALGILVAGCLDHATATFPPVVKPFEPTVTGIIERFEDASDGGPAYILDDGSRVEVDPTIRTVLTGGGDPGDLLASGSDGGGRWIAKLHRRPDSSPECFDAQGSVFDDGDAIVFEAFRFQKAKEFTTQFPATKRGDRYPIGNPCFNRAFEVVTVG